MVQIVFWFFAIMAVVGAVLCITQKAPVASALWLISVMLALACIFVLLNAQFIGAIQVLVYAGAVMVLFLFVIMLLNLSRPTGDIKGFGKRLLALIGGAALLAQLGPVVNYSPERLALEYTQSPLLADPDVVFDAARQGAVEAAARGVPGDIAVPLFQQYLVPFELTSILLLAAIVGAVVLAKRRL